MIIREIQPDDAAVMADIVKEVILEMGAPKTGTAYEDAALEDLHKAYRTKGSMYFVLEDQSEVVGGAGIAPLQNASDAICELQKMYFLRKVRGQGYGMKLIQYCLEAAKSLGYTQCYIETMNSMTAAQNLYKKLGFKTLEAPVGTTGHSSCQVWLIKELH